MDNKNGGIKDLIIPICFAVIGAWMFHYFFLSKSDSSPKESTDFIAPVAGQKYKPLNTEINFMCDVKPTKQTFTQVDPGWGELTFSSYGASLDRLVFKREINGKQQLLTTVYPVQETERENRCFLVALDQATPYYYTFDGRTDFDDYIALTYHADYNGGTIRKTFMVHKKEYKIDVVLEVEPIAGGQSEIELRLQCPSPIIPDIGHNDLISAVIIGAQDAFEKIPAAKLDLQRGFFAPRIFGSDNRYFIHTMVDDENQFTARAYYKFVNQNSIVAILESPRVSEKTTWKLSFYCGPKEEAAMAAVDSRLQKTLDYAGFLAPISQFLLKILNWFYKYVGNYGLAIILLTFLIKLVLLPFSWGSEASAQKQKEVQKKLAYLQQRYKNDPETLRREKEEVIRKHGLPGLGSCLPLLIQMPIFFALSRLLSSSIELYGASMLWIADLSVPDPYYIIPFLVLCIMLLQATTMDASQRMTFVMMAFVFGAISTTMSAGLALYIAVSTLLGVMQISAGKMFARG